MANKYVTVNTSVNQSAQYLTDGSKRITGNTMTESFWDNYNTLYYSYIAEKKLLFRGKTVNSDNKFVITQIWDSKTSRDAWEVSTRKDQYDASGEMPMQYAGYELDSAGINSLIANIISAENYIVQICDDEYRTTGMKIGDSLKGDTVFTV